MDITRLLVQGQKDLFLGPFLPFFLAYAFLLQPKRHIIQNRQPREQGMILKHNHTVGAWSRNRLAVDFNASLF
ncbi:hypothetical protein, partial [Paenibacillus larvae]|uniref:hypothetical protein n=1 Tax=Paenibacillus larvae TaxID=1464 RepID=UPI001ED97FC2